MMTKDNNQFVKLAGVARYKAHAFREAAELEAGLLTQASGPVESARAQLAGSLMLAIRTWHWRRISKRRLSTGEGADLAAHTNALLRILERYDTDKPPTPQSSPADSH